MIKEDMSRRDRKKSSLPLRLFIAAYPPVDLTRRLLDLMRRLDLPPHRETPEEQIHLTLQFIGDRPARDVEGIIESILRAKKGLRAIDLQPERIIPLPQDTTPPRLMAVETDAPPDLIELQSRLTRRFARRGRQRPHDRYLPHMTLLRFRPDAARTTTADHEASSRIEPIPLDAAEWPRFRIDSISLMKSILTPHGARHEQLTAIPLPPPATS